MNTLPEKKRVFIKRSGADIREAVVRLLLRMSKDYPLESSNHFKEAVRRVRRIPVAGNYGRSPV